MKESIKKRIEAVRRGEVPEGNVSQNHQLRPVDWKYEKIGKYLVPYDEFSNDTKAYPLATSSRQGLMLQSEYYIDQRYEETTGGFHVVPVGYVTYRHMSDDDIFRFNLNKIGQSVLVSPEYPVFTTTGGLNQDLLVAYLNGMKEFQAFCSAQKKGSTRTRMYFRRLCEFTIPIPSITEQQKIAEILATCDRMIELKQSKIDELKKLKQVCLLEMFPQKGQTIPKRRFPGFSAPWEQRKLNEVGVVIDPHPSHRAPKETTEGIPFIGIGDVDEDGNINKSSARIVNEKVFDEHRRRYDLNIPSLGLGRVASLGKVIRLRADIGKYAVSPTMSVLQFNNDVNIDYIYAYMNSSQFQWQFEGKSNGSTRQSVGTEMVRILNLAIPADIKEQQQIGSYFSNLDHLITLHQRELAEAGKYKKALMQLLLTGLVRVKA